MFCTKNEKSTNCPARAVAPIAIAMEKAARTSGMRPATTAPRTTSSTINATIEPMPSPFAMSSSMISLNWLKRVAGPATWVSNPSGRSTDVTASSRSFASSASASSSVSVMRTGSSAARPLSETGPSSLR